MIFRTVSPTVAINVPSLFVFIFLNLVLPLIQCNCIFFIDIYITVFAWINKCFHCHCHCHTLGTIGRRLISWRNFMIIVAPPVAILIGWIFTNELFSDLEYESTWRFSTVFGGCEKHLACLALCHAANLLMGNPYYSSFLLGVRRSTPVLFLDWLLYFLYERLVRRDYAMDGNYINFWSMV
jgi:hypothetical protein